MTDWVLVTGRWSSSPAAGDQRPFQTLLRQLGAAPGKSMDMIAFYRERGAKT